MSTQAAGSSLTDSVPILREYFASQPVRNLLERDHSFFAMVEKDTDFSGEYYPVPVQYGTTTGYSQFGYAQTNQSPDQFAKFMVPIVTDYAVATIQNAARLASRNQTGAFLDLSKARLKGAMEEASSRAANALYRGGTGSLGQISAISTGVITLVNPTDAIFFQQNQVLQATSSDGGGTTRAGVGYVIAVDFSAGTITVSTSAGGSAGTPSGWTANDFVLNQGDLNNRAAGLSAWLPLTGRNSLGTFFGVDRSKDPTRLAGVYYDGSGQTIEEALIEGVSQVCLLGGRPDYLFVHPVSFRNLAKSLQSRAQYITETIENDAGVSFTSIVIHGDKGPVRVLSDSDCLPKTAFALQMDTWKMISYGDAPQVLTYEDGVSMFRTANNDSLEARVGGYYNLICNAPGRNGCFKLPI